MNKLLALDPLSIGSYCDNRFSTIDEALMEAGDEFSLEQLAAALDAQIGIPVTGSTLYRWRRELEALDQS